MTDNFYSFIFDSGSDDYNEYNIFDCIIRSLRELALPSNIKIYYGDIIDSFRNVDLEPFINRNEMCTIVGKPRLTDWPYYVCLYGISQSDRDYIEKGLKKFKYYIGSSNVELETKIKTKKVWTCLIEDIKVCGDTVYFYSFDLLENKFEELFKKHGFNIQYLEMDEEPLPISTDGDEEYVLIQNAFVSGYRLNVEIRVSGGLIWDSIEKLNNVSYFPKLLDDDAEPSNTEDCYMCIYNASQGIERLQKSVIELILNRDNCSLENEDKIYKMLMSHSHSGLNAFIEKYLDVDLTKYRRLVDDLTKFYNYIRYTNYSVYSEYSRTYFYNILCSYGNIDKSKDSVSAVELESFKHIFASLLGDYALFLYETIKNISYELGIFTYELDSSSKSAIVFLRDKKENLYKIYKKYLQSKKEVLYYLATEAETKIKHVFDIKPLAFDDEAISLYCREIIENSGYDYFDSVDVLYDEMCKENKEEFKNRISQVEFLFSNDFDYYN